MIRKAEQRDIDAVEDGYAQLLTYEQTHGTQSNWALGIYPTRQVAQDSLEAGTLYVLEDGGEICASMILNHVQPEEYRRMDWSYPAEDTQVLVLHTLCVPPSRSGRGYGKQMVRYAMELARETGMSAVRLDTWAGNTPAAMLYQGFGFRYVGKTEVMLQGVIPEEQVFFEWQPRA